MQVLSWNVGGLTATKVLEVLLALGQHGIRPFQDALVILVQEVICEPGKHHSQLDALQIIFGKGNVAHCRIVAF